MTKEDTQKLMPCPFCGGEAHYSTQMCRDGLHEHIVCLNCCSQNDNGIKAWNTRHIPDIELKDVVSWAMRVNSDLDDGYTNDERDLASTILFHQSDEPIIRNTPDIEQACKTCKAPLKKVEVERGQHGMERTCACKFSDVHVKDGSVEQAVEALEITTKALKDIIQLTYSIDYVSNGKEYGIADKALQTLEKLKGKK